MADRTMEELLQAPTEGYGEGIVIPKILAKKFEIKTNLLQLVQANKFHGFERDDPHTHIGNFKRMTATLKCRDVSNDAIKLMLFSYSLEDRARIWYEKEPPKSIITWDDLVNKFVNQFFPPSKTTHLKNEISRFTQRFEETFSEAWDRFKELLRACPHHGFSELTQIDTFYNGLTEQDQDSLNAVAGGNLLNKTTREALKIIENKSKISNLVKIVKKQVIAPAKAVEKTCVTCGGAHAYYEYIATDSNPSSVCAATGSYNQVSPPNRAAHQIPPPGFAMVQNDPTRFNQNQGQGNYFNQPSTSGTLPSNTVPNPKGEIKIVTTRSGLANEGPSIPIESPLEKVDEQNTEEILDKEHSNSSGSTAQVQPSVVPISILEPDVPRTQTKPTIPYPSRLNDQKLREKATNQMEKFFQIFHDLHFDISFADALLLMPKFASTIKSLLANKDKLFELAKVSLNENCSAILLKKLPENLGDPMVDFEVDLRVPLILRRSFLRTGHALIDVYGEKITLRDVLDFQYNPKSSSPTLVSYDLIFKSDSNPFQLPPMDLKLDEESKDKSSVEEPLELELKELPSRLEYAFLEDSNKLPVIIAKNLKVDEKEALINVLKSQKWAIAWKISDIKGIDPRCMMSIFLDLIEKTMEVFMEDFLVFGDSFSSCLTNLDKMLNRCEETNLVLNWEKCHFICREGIVLGHKISKSGIEVDRAKVDVIAKLPHPTTVKGVRSFLGHAGFYHRFIQDFSKIARPMTHLLEKETHVVFSKKCIDAFNTLKKKLTEAPILVVPHWNLPFELMCDANDYAIGPENLAADHLSRLKNPHQDVLENKDINENFPLETLGSLTSHSTPWKLLKFSKLAMRDLLEAIMVPISQRRSDRETHFCNDQFTKVMIKYGVTHRLATAYHPQTSGQVEVSNRGLKRILERTVGENRNHRKLQLNELSELRDQAYENSVIYKERMKKLHDSKIKNRIFNVDDQVLLFNYRLKIFSGKLKIRWSGPFTITHVFPYGTIELSQPNGPISR
nr:reverse transcriptase domain-containing protein [Tanacetum cinerariifolium]